MRTLRVVSINIWNDREPARRRLELLCSGLAALEADLIALQEVRREGAAGDQGEAIARAAGGRLYFDPVEETREGGPIGNAIISRLPIVRTESILLPGPPGDPRRALWAQVMLTDGRSLGFTSTHLSWELEESARREAQVVALDEFVRAKPTEVPQIMAGDFNAPPDSDAVRFLNGRCSLSSASTYWRDAWSRVRPHEDGFTWSSKNPYAARSVERDRRIDYIFAGPHKWPDVSVGAVHECKVVLDLPGAEGVYPSDHFGLLAVFGLAMEGPQLAPARPPVPHPDPGVPHSGP